MKRQMIYSIATASMLILGAGAALAQNETPPDTNVRALEAPTDVRQKQLRAQRKPMTTPRAFHHEVPRHHIPRHHTGSTSITRH